LDFKGSMSCFDHDTTRRGGFCCIYLTH
jgi:hypothetical protein